jgi:hypothetical protein
MRQNLPRERLLFASYTLTQPPSIFKWPALWSVSAPREARHGYSPPVMNLLSSLAKKATTFATSSGRPKRPSAVSSLSSSNFSWLQPSLKPGPESIMDVWIVLTRISNSPSSSAAVSAIPRRANLLAEYEIRPGKPRRPAILERKIIEPPWPWSRSTLATCFSPRKAMRCVSAARHV